MQIQIFTIPILGGEEMMQEMNHFLRANRVSDIQKTMTQSAGVSYWTFCITYLPQCPVKGADAVLPRKSKIDYREVLEEPEFVRFCEYRKIRKQIAENQAIPPYAVFTDAELAEIAKLDPPSLKGLKSIPGIGDKKVEKYGAYFIDVKENEEGGQSD